jgi:putative transposase
MSCAYIYIHIVFGVKSRYPTLQTEKRHLLFEHIVSNAKGKNIDILQINGHDDHVHTLVRLSTSQSVSKIIQFIKGESAWWTNQQLLFENKLIWSKGYYARTVDPANLRIVRKYIAGQTKHGKGFEYVQIYMESIKD